MHIKKRVNKIVIYILGIVIAITMFFPIYWLIISSFKPTEYLFEPTLFPSVISFKSYINVLNDPSIKKGFINSSIVAFTSTFFSLLLSSLAGYGFSRFRFKGHNFLFLSLIFSKMFPVSMLAIGYFSIIIRLNLYDTLFSLILMNTAIILPLSLWIIKNFFDTIPIEIEEAALIDGCSRLKAIFYIILPISKVGMASVVIYSFLMVWQEFFYAFTFTSSSDNRLIPVVIYSYFGQFFTDYSSLFAISVLFLLPLILLFVFAQRYLIQGFTAGSLK